MVKPEPPRMDWIDKLPFAKWLYNLWNWVVYHRVITVSGAVTAVGANSYLQQTYTEASIDPKDVIVPVSASTVGNMHVIGSTAGTGQVTFTFWHPGGGSENTPATIDCIVMRK